MFRNEWRALYRRAILETDVDKLLERVNEADNAIAERLSLDGEVPAGERRELQAAKNSLRLFRNERAELHADLDGNQ